MIFYLDGKAFPAPDYDPGFKFITDLAVGTRVDNHGRGRFFGTVDELAVYNRTLSVDEVKAIYDAQK